VATQSELDTLAATLKQLENQKGEAQKRLNDLKGQVTEFIQSGTWLALPDVMVPFETGCWKQHVHCHYYTNHKLSKVISTFYLFSS
jgi:hypothetical protein